MPLGTVKRREGLFQGETLRHGRGHGECRVEQHKYFVFMMNILRVTTLTTPHCTMGQSPKGMVYFLELAIVRVAGC